MNKTERAMWITPLSAIAQEAGQRIMKYYRGAFESRAKADKSPVTEADMAAHDFIVAALSRDFPGIPVVSEEDANFTDVKEAAFFFLVDPLDGTRSFVRGEGEFTVNIGLVQGNVPTLGVIYAPVAQALYYGGKDIGAFRQQKGDAAAQQINVRPIPPEGLTVTRSRTAPLGPTKVFLETLKIAEMRPSSSSIKFCWLAEGEADLYPRFGRTMEWDTAAGQAILEAAGGSVTTVDGQPFTYGKPGFENVGFIARGTQ